MIINIISIVLFGIYAAIILYYRQGWQSLTTSYKSDFETPDPSTLITVIIPARNEEANIGTCLKSVLKQSYPKVLFEIIVIDDHSTDGTPAIVESFIQENVRLISLKEFAENKKIISYKKMAIDIAISQAKGSLIVTTDADCIAQPEWLMTIASVYEKYHPVFIAAPVCYFGGNNFLKIFQSLDFMTLQGITGAAISRKFHSMCNGANLAYEKKVFYEVEGFKDIDTIASGDDMLLLHKIGKKYPDNIMFLRSQKAIVFTKAAENLSAFFNQRIRWASKSGSYYEKNITAVLVLVYIFNLWMLVSGILSFFSLENFYWFIHLILAKTIIEIFFLLPVAKFFRKKNLLWWFPVAQPFHILYTIIAGWLGKFGSYKWKGRIIDK